VAKEVIVGNHATGKRESEITTIDEELLYQLHQGKRRYVRKDAATGEANDHVKYVPYLVASISTAEQSSARKIPFN